MNIEAWTVEMKGRLRTIDGLDFSPDHRVALYQAAITPIHYWQQEYEKKRLHEPVINSGEVVLLQDTLISMLTPDNLIKLNKYLIENKLIKGSTVRSIREMKKEEVVKCLNLLEG